MKYIISTLAVAFLTAAFSFSAEAQVLNRLKKKAQDAAERKAEEKVAEQVELAAERMVEKSWNSIFGEINEDSLSGNRLPFTRNSNVKTEDVYNFNTITTMEINTVKEDGSSDPPVIMDMHFNNGEMYTGTKFRSEEMDNKDEELFIVYDFNNSAMLMLMGNEGDKFSFAYNWEENLDSQTAQESQEIENPDTEQTYPEYSKIGNKDILGYNCEGYRSEDQNQVVEIWISREADFGMHSMFKAHANAKQIKGKLPEDYPSGMVMEMVAEDLQNGEKTTMQVINIDEKARVQYVMADYPTMSFGSKTQENK